MVPLYTSQLAYTVVSISRVSVLLAAVSNTFPFNHTDLFSSQLCLWLRTSGRAALSSPQTHRVIPEEKSYGIVYGIG